MGYRVLNWSGALVFFGCLLLGLNPEWHPSWFSSVIGYVPYVLAGVNFGVFFVSMLQHDKVARRLSLQERRRAMREHWGMAQYLFLAMLLASIAGFALFQSSIAAAVDAAPQSPQIRSTLDGLRFLFIAMMSACVFLWLNANKRVFAAAKAQGQ